jgi:hypothetical protein
VYAVLLALVGGCTLPPVLTPVRIADRGLAPLARTAEVRLSPTVYFEQERRPFEDNTAQLRFDQHDIAVRPNLFAGFAFTDSFTMLLPAGVLWSPVVQLERGLWVTLGGGVYGFAFGSDGVAVTDAVGVWAKRRFGSAFWLTGGIAAFHAYDSNEREPVDERRPKNVIWLIPGVEAGVQLADPWALTLLADYGHDLIGDVVPYSRLRTEIVLVPVWWIDLGVHGGLYLHARESLHVDPLVGFSATWRW